jgi:hypothetical protein
MMGNAVTGGSVMTAVDFGMTKERTDEFTSVSV